MLSKHTIVLKKNTAYFGVRFLSLHVSGKSKINMKDLISQSCQLSDFIKITSGEVEPIFTAATFSDKIQLFKDILGDVLAIQPESRLVRFALNQMIMAKGNLSVHDLAVQTAYSERYLRKQFEHFVGLSPKLFGQITRFQHALRSLISLTDPSTLWDSISINEYYYDQPHFINEFKKFTQETPQAWVKRCLQG